MTEPQAHLLVVDDDERIRGLLQKFLIRSGFLCSVARDAAQARRLLAGLEGRPVAALDDRTIWTLAMRGDDSLAAAAADRFCLSLGSVAGDLALAQGASAVVIAGGLGLRIRDSLVRSGFPERFVAKGRFENLMAAMPVKLITHPQPGLFGAAAAFARQHL